MYAMRFGGIPRWRRPRMVVSGLAAVTVVIAGACSAEKSVPSEPSKRHAAPSVKHSPTTQRWPLTGRPVAGKLPDRPVLVVKVDNTTSAQPQRGLRAADLVVEELVEGGLTRLAAFYHSTLPPVVGPVRSMRTTDVALTAPVDGTLVATGGAKPTRTATHRAGVHSALGAAGFFRAANRPAPYDVMLHPRALTKTQPQRPPRQAFLPWARGGQFELGSLPKQELTATFSPQHTTRWRFGGGRGWVRIGERAAAGQDFVADTVLVLRVRTRPAGYRDPAGNPVPETILKGHGRAWILAGPRLVKARWTKGGPHAPFRLTSKDGETLALPPGNTWIELVPASGSVAAE